MWLSSVFLKTLRDYRIPIFGWGIGMGLVVVSPMASVATLLPTPQARAQLVSLAATFAWNADVVAVDTIGGYATFKIGIFIFLATALPWYVLVQMRNPQFFGEFILRQNFARFGTNLYQHQKPFWFYLPVLLGSLLPWSVLAVAAWIAALKTAQPRAAVPPQSAWFQRFLVLWAIVPVIFFTLAQSKLPGYILPAIPAWTILVADYLQQLREGSRRLNFGVLAGHAALVAFSVAAALLSPYAIVQKGFHPPLSALLVAAGFAATFFVIIMYTVRRRGIGTLRFLTTAAVILSLTYLLRVVAPATDAALSARPLARYIGQMPDAPREVAVYDVPRGIQYGLAFYRDQRVSRYDANLDGPGEVPVGEHLLLIRGASANTFSLPAEVGQREFKNESRFPPLDLWVVRVGAKGTSPIPEPDSAK